jgi:hypothetical protein
MAGVVSRGDVQLKKAEGSCFRCSLLHHFASGEVTSELDHVDVGVVLVSDNRGNSVEHEERLLVFTLLLWRQTMLNSVTIEEELLNKLTLLECMYNVAMND